MGNDNPLLKKRPPSLAIKLLRWYCVPHRIEELEGDLEELYSLRIKRGGSKVRADFFFWWNVVRCFKSYARNPNPKKTIMISLIKSYVTLALRHSWKNKGPVSINILGLGLALSMCVFVYMMYAYNLEFDNFYRNTADIYRLHSITVQNGEERRNEFSPFALDDQLRNSLGGVQAVSSFFTENITVKNNQSFYTQTAGIISQDFTQMFELPLSYGSFADLADQPTVYLTKSLATKYFGKEVALGKTLTLILTNEQKMDLVVAGVLEKIPLNSSFRFDLLISHKSYTEAMDLDVNDWSSGQFTGHYLKLSQTQMQVVTKALNTYIPLQNEQYKELKIRRFELIPFAAPLPTDLIRAARFVNRRLRPEGLIIFSTLAMLVFFTACFNLANTSMALMSRRLKEIGIRKTMGSGSGQILFQFLLEMAVISSLAFVIALSAAHFGLTVLASQLGISFMLQDINLLGVILFVAGFLLVTTLVAGVLPALYARRFQAIDIMRKSAKLKGVSWLNKLLVIGQYTFSIAVLAAGIAFSQNVDFLDEMDLGYEDDQIINLPTESKYVAIIKQEVDQIPGVSTAGSATHIGDFGRYSERADVQIDTSFHEVRHHAVGRQYLSLMQVQIVDGRGFLEGPNSDKNSVLVNREFVRQHFPGQKAINKIIKVNGERKTIVGVTEDLIDDVVKAAELIPTTITVAAEEEFRHLTVKVDGKQLGTVEDQLKNIWHKHIDKPYAGFRQKDFALGASGEDSKALQKIFMIMAILSGFLSMTGIFSLAKLNVTRHSKELGIRKVLGASLHELLQTLNKPFLWTLTLSLIAGSGLGYVITNSVLDAMYKYHVQVSLMTTSLSGILVVFVAMVMLSSVALGPANASPVYQLRDE